MTFMMKRFANAHRRNRSRPAGGRAVSCEVLECRRLLSSGTQGGGLAGGIQTVGSERWESRWADIAPTAWSTGGQSQVVSNRMSAGLGGDFEWVPGSATGPIVGEGSDISTAGSMGTNASIGPTPAVVEVDQGGTQGEFVSGGSGISTGGLTAAAAPMGTAPGVVEIGQGSASGRS